MLRLLARFLHWLRLLALPIEVRSAQRASPHRTAPRQQIRRYRASAQVRYGGGHASKQGCRRVSVMLVLLWSRRSVDITGDWRTPVVTPADSYGFMGLHLGHRQLGPIPGIAAVGKMALLGAGAGRLGCHRGQPGPVPRWGYLNSNLKLDSAGANALRVMGIISRLLWAGTRSCSSRRRRRAIRPITGPSPRRGQAPRRPDQRVGGLERAEPAPLFMGFIGLTRRAATCDMLKSACSAIKSSCSRAPP